MEHEFLCTSCRKLKPLIERCTRAGNEVCTDCLNRIKAFHRNRATQNTGKTNA